MSLSKVWLWLLAFGREALQFFGPIEDHAHFVGRPLFHVGFHEEEPLTVGAHIVAGIAQAIRQARGNVRDDLWNGCSEVWLGRHAHAHDFVRAQVEELPAISCPDWPIAA